jgi:predicted helicase
LRPLRDGQPWGIFFVDFEPKRLPVVVLRRILRALVVKKRQSANKAHQKGWKLHDLLFISSYGEADHRDITFAHFSEATKNGDLPLLRVLGWDDEDTAWHLDHAHQTLCRKLRWPQDDAPIDQWRSTWSAAFSQDHREVIRTSKDLAVRLAGLARRIRKRAHAVLLHESEKGPLRRLQAAVREALIHELSEDDFADMYAQTVAYGLLSARVSRPAGLVADDVVQMVPATNPFLKELLQSFLTVGGRKGLIDFDELGISEVVETLRVANMEAVLRNFGDKNPQEDPVIHFYELFLKVYDSKKRMQRGVFYTPRPVVSYIVRSVHELLQTEFGLEDGLASTVTWGGMAKRHKGLQLPDGTSADAPFVTILDPATGTATFLVEIIDVIRRTMLDKWTKRKLNKKEIADAWNDYVPKHLLPRLHGYELMMAPYAIAHMKIGLKLGEEPRYNFLSNERARIYLTNALEPATDAKEQPEFEEWAPALAHEAKAVNAVKRHQLFTVVIGNPPYSINSCNLQSSAVLFVEPFRYVDGEKIRERGALKFETILQDDYIKFWGLGLQILRGTPAGIISMITNNGFLTNRVLRGMRKALIDNYGRLIFYNLPGNRSKGEKCPDGSPDDNVFDIDQGVGISVLGKTLVRSTPGVVELADLWGIEDTKYRTLACSSTSQTHFQPQNPKSPYYAFAVVDEVAEDEYRSFAALDEVMPFNKAGFVSGRDEFAVDFDARVLEARISDFLDPKQNEAAIRERYSIKDAGGYTLSKRRQPALAARLKAKDIIKAVQHRPFDFRFVAYSEAVLTSPQKAAMHQLSAGNNVAFCLSRGAEIIRGCEHIFCTRAIVQHHTVSLKEVNYVFPLYVFAEKGSLTLRSGKSQNFGTDFLRSLAARLSLSPDRDSNLPLGFTPEDIFYYAYGIFHSPGYRSRYAEFLKTDFPRLPLTGSLELFRAVVGLGAELVALHLLESRKLDKPRTELIDVGKPEVEKVFWSNETVWIDKAQTTGFKGVPETVWNFHIGGYQVCEKWLKDRKGRTLFKGRHSALSPDHRRSRRNHVLDEGN